ncbi:hypothetical protein K1719_018368 [Acacia pycnantha]|nr:hypothetical protein K1719_018368 [Acacia pycnantha]
MMSNTSRGLTPLRSWQSLSSSIVHGLRKKQVEQIREEGDGEGGVVEDEGKGGGGGGSGNGKGGNGLAEVPAVLRKMVQRLKEIVSDFPKHEIYAMLKEFKGVFRFEFSPHHLGRAKKENLVETCEE